MFLYYFCHSAPFSHHFLLHFDVFCSFTATSHLTTTASEMLCTKAFQETCGSVAAKRQKIKTIHFRFFSPKGDVFATMKAVFWNKTILGFRPVQELALRHKDGRTGCGAEGHSHHEWCFCGFCLLHHQGGCLVGYGRMMGG